MQGYNGRGVKRLKLEGCELIIARVKWKGCEVIIG